MKRNFVEFQSYMEIYHKQSDIMIWVITNNKSVLKNFRSLSYFLVNLIEEDLNQ